MNERNLRPIPVHREPYCQPRGVSLFATWAFWLSLLLVAVVFLCCASYASEPQLSGELWARVETTAPAVRRPYLLRATIPTGGEAVPVLKIGEHRCQTTPVVRREGVDVVELVCPVTGPGPFEVKRADRGFIGRLPRASKRIPSRFDLIMKREGLRDLHAEMRWTEGLQAGRWQIIRRHWGTFNDAEGLELGVRVFETRRSTSSVVELTVEITNTVVDPGSPAFSGPVYFDSIDLVPRRGVGVLAAVQRSSMKRKRDGTRITLVDELEGGGLHVLPAQYSFHRRLALYPLDPGSSIREARSILDCEGQGWSTAGHAFTITGGWGPHGLRQIGEIPDSFQQGGRKGIVAWLARTEGGVRGLTLALETGKNAGGKWGAHHDAMGWAQPLGHRLGWAHGGEGIEFTWSVVTRSPEFRLARLQAEMRAERQDVHASHPRDGHPITPHEWANSTGTQPFRVIAGSDRAFGVPYFKNVSGSAWNKGSSPYAGALAKITHHDDQHFIRAAKEPARLVWLMADPWARERAVSNACYLWSTIPDLEVKGGEGLLDKLERNRAQPHRRGELSRGAGWTLYTAAIAWLVGNDEYRNASGAWNQGLGEWAQLTTLPNGVSMRRNEHNQNWSSEPWQDRPGKQTLDHDHDALQAIEERIAKNGTFVLAVSGAVDDATAGELLADVVASADFMARELVVNQWGKKGSPSFVSVAKHAKPVNHEKALSWYGGPEVVNAISAVGLAFELTGEQRFREQLFDLWGLEGAKRTDADLERKLWQQEAEHSKHSPGWSVHASFILAGLER